VTNLVSRALTPLHNGEEKLSDFIKCPTCGASSPFYGTAEILNKYQGQFYRCSECFFISLHNPTWLKEAYENPINDTDIGLVSRNSSIAPVLDLLFRWLRTRRILDYGAGTGLMVRMLRDLGHQAFYFDRFPDNVFAKGFEATLPLENYQAVIAVELAEHVSNPVELFTELFAISPLVIVSTEKVPSPSPQISDWYYFGTEHGQHVSFYTEQSFQYLAKKFNANYFYIAGLHMFFQDQEPPPWLKLILRKRRIANLLSSILPHKSLIEDDFFKISGRTLK
jgi:SAM-dependent methyltransferase